MTLLKRFGLFAIMLICLSACKKEYTAIGLNLEDEMLGTVLDTSTVRAYSVLIDSVYTTNLTNQLLGGITDDIFGKSDATIYSQFRLSGASLNFGVDPVLDSVVLTLQIAGYYGDTTSALRFGVYELTEDLSTETSYYSTNSTAHNSTNLLSRPSQDYYVHPNKNVILDTATLSPHMRIRLVNELGQRFIDHASEWLTDDILLEYFKGLCIHIESYTNKGCIVYTNMTSTLTALTIYYHNNLDNGLSYSLLPSDEGVRYCNFNHFNFSDACADLQRQVIQHDTTGIISTLYLQPMAGVKTKVRFPNIHNMFTSINNRVLINRAELVITNARPYEYFFKCPSNLTIEGVLKDGTTTYIPDDELVSSEGFFGGRYDETTGEYRIRVTRYIQQLILDQGNYADYFYLQVKGGGVRANRLVFYGDTPASEGTPKLRLDMVYTTY